jgi:hypothetical protein
MTARDPAPALRVPADAPRRALLALLAVAVALAALSLAGSWLEHERPLGGAALMAVHFVNLDLERNLPTWYAMSTLFACAALAALVPRAGALAPGLRRWHWRLLAGALAAVSLDEMAELHERLAVPMRTAWGSAGPLRHAAWVIPASAALVALGVAMLPFLRHLPGRTRAIFVAAGATYVSGGLVAESASGPFAERYGTGSFGYAAFTTVEELLEMVGVALAIYGLLDHLARRAPAPGAAGGRPARLLRTLAVASLAVAAISFAGALARRSLALPSPALAVIGFLDVDQEGNLPTWLSSVGLLSCAALAALVPAVGRPREPRPRRWLLLAAALAIASLDEMAMMHERLANRLHAAPGAGELLAYAPAALGLVLAAAFLVAMVPLLRALPGPTRAALLAAGALYAAGAGALGLASTALAARGGAGLAGDALATLEALLELLGTSLLLHALVARIRERAAGAAAPAPGRDAQPAWPEPAALPEP